MYLLSILKIEFSRKKDLGKLCLGVKVLNTLFTICIIKKLTSVFVLCYKNMNVHLDTKYFSLKNRLEIEQGPGRDYFMSCD